MNEDLLAVELEQEEGFSKTVYKDSTGKWTIGIGICVDPSVPGAGLTLQEARWLIVQRINSCSSDLARALSWYDRVPEPVQRALCDMTFQLGLRGVLAFEKMITLIRQGQYGQAADEGLNSEWARQTPARAKRVTDLLRSAT